MYFNLLEFEDPKRDGNSTDIKSREIVFVQNRTECYPLSNGIANNNTENSQKI